MKQLPSIPLKPIATFLLLFIGSLASNAAPEKLDAKLEMSQGIDGEFEPGQRGKLLVPDTAFDHCYHFPQDVRILATDGTQWPFFLYVPYSKTIDRTIEAEILNQSFVKGHHPYYQADIVIPLTEAGVLNHNQIEISTTGSNFIRQVKLYSNVENQPQALMTTGYLINDARHRNAENKIVRYPKSDLSRLHLRIYTNAKDNSESFELDKVSIKYSTHLESAQERVDYSEVELPPNEVDDKAQVLILDTHTRNRPIESIVFDIRNNSYHRSVSIYGRDESYEPWDWVAGGIIHSWDNDVENTLKFGTKHRYLKVKIFHHDDLPLDIGSITLEALPRYFVFEAVTAGRANLHYGNPTVERPRYDLRQRLTDETVEQLPVYQTLEPPHEETSGIFFWKRYSKLLGTGAIALVSLLVIGVIFSMMRQMRNSEEESGE